MPAPRLLDKKTVNAELATERKRQIDEGRRLTDSIEALREAKVKEEQALEDFRKHTISVVQIEVDRKQKEARERIGLLRNEEESLKARIAGLQSLEAQLKEELMTNL